MRSAALLVFSAIATAAISGCAVVQTEYGEGVAIYATQPPAGSDFHDPEDGRKAATRQVLMICTGFKTMRLNCWKPDDETAVADANAAPEENRGVLDDIPATGKVILHQTASESAPSSRGGSAVRSAPIRNEPGRKSPERPEPDRYAPRVPRPPQLVKPADPLAPGDARLRLPNAVAGVY